MPGHCRAEHQTLFQIHCEYWLSEQYCCQNQCQHLFSQILRYSQDQTHFQQYRGSEQLVGYLNQTVFRLQAWHQTLCLLDQRQNLRQQSAQWLKYCLCQGRIEHLHLLSHQLRCAKDQIRTHLWQYLWWCRLCRHRCRIQFLLLLLCQLLYWKDQNQKPHPQFEVLTLHPERECHLHLRVQIPGKLLRHQLAARTYFQELLQAAHLIVQSLHRWFRNKQHYLRWSLCLPKAE